jgi:hypothetical protein
MANDFRPGEFPKRGMPDLILKETTNWLRVLGTTEIPDIDHRVGHQFHRIVPTLDALKPHQ